MGGKNEAAAQQAIKKLEQGAIEQLEFIVPEKVEDFGIRQQSVTAQAKVIKQDAFGFVEQACVMVLIAAQVQEFDEMIGMQFRAINFIAADEVEGYALDSQGGGETESVRPILAASEQSDA